MFKKTNIFLSKLVRCYSNSLGIIGVPFGKGQPKAGVNNAPKILRESGLVGELKNISETFTVKDYGDISYNVNKCNYMENMLNYEDFICCNKELSLKVQQILKENDSYLVLGGDHSIGFGSIAGHLAYDPNITVVWIDAHADLNVNKSSPSGNIHGMPVSMLLQELKRNWTNSNVEALMTNYIPAKNIIYIGLRDVDSYESFLLKKYGIRAYGMDSVDKHGITKIVEMVLETIDPKSNLHVSFDIDVLDVDVAPSTGTAVTGGLTLREGIVAVEMLSATNRITGFDLVEINPSIGNNDEVQQTIQAGMQIVKAAFGYNRLGAPRDILKNN